MTAARARTCSGGWQTKNWGTDTVSFSLRIFVPIPNDLFFMRFYAFLYGSRADSCRSTYGFSGRRILQRVGDARPLWKMHRFLPPPTFRPPSHVLPFSLSLSPSLPLSLPLSLPFSSSLLPSLSLSLFIRHRGVILLRFAGCKPRSGSGRRQRPVVMVRSGIRP